MAETSPAPRGPAPGSVIPQKRGLGLEDDQHAPAVSSPLNPDFANARARKAPPAREQREKKESLKKREAKGVDNARGGTPDTQSHGRGTKKKGQEAATNSQSLIRYTIPLPKRHDFDPPGPPVLVPSMVRAGRQFYESQEHVYNRKGFRYTHCIADPEFRFTQYHRQSETEPFTARFDYEDSSSHIRFDKAGRAVTTEKGFRMARANVGIREGRWYWECKVVRGVKNPNNLSPMDSDTGGHVRMGISRREAPLETPVGFDAYSYGVRDLAGQKVHRSRPQDFFPTSESICEGDVIGFELQLPSLALHRKVVDGTYNKAVDVSDDADPHALEAPNIIRDRLPIRYKSQLYFEQFEYTAIKEVEELTYPPSSTTTAPAGAAGQAPNPNHPLAVLRTLPNSRIKVYKNGVDMGTLYDNLLAFLPPASKPAIQSGVVGAREGLDDGMLGYYPSLSVFQGGSAEANFGPSFWFPPPELSQSTGPAATAAVIGDEDVDMVGAHGTNGAASSSTATARSTATAAARRGVTTLNDCMAELKRLRPLSERYDEQIAEDVLYDCLDEVDLWMTDGGDLDARPGVSSSGPPLAGPVDPQGRQRVAGSGKGLEMAIGMDVRDGMLGVQQAVVGGNGELNEIVQDEE
ncbi:MAG: hypothetical protein LQ340_000170 [Diploschistes diacapsis]|nr:MAG: hypothetical protein LQ340_000170 [Diploschistes diacapsis]